jgi:hypothetical protein
MEVMSPLFSQSLEAALVLPCFLTGRYILPVKNTSCVPTAGDLKLLVQEACALWVVSWDLSRASIVRLLLKIKIKKGPVVVALPCIASYLGTRDWEDHSWRPARAKS